MSQPLGYAVGNALEVMEASQTLQNAGPTDLTKLCIELAARMIFLGKMAATLDEARRTAEQRLVDGSAYKKLKQVVAAATPRLWSASSCCPTPPACVRSLPRAAAT